MGPAAFSLAGKGAVALGSDGGTQEKGEGRKGEREGRRKGEERGEERRERWGRGTDRC